VPSNDILSRPVLRGASPDHGCDAGHVVGLRPENLDSGLILFFRGGKNDESYKRTQNLAFWKENIPPKWREVWWRNFGESAELIYVWLSGEIARPKYPPPFTPYLPTYLPNLPISHAQTGLL